ncbi:MAG: DJ-1/PfpI family protein [Candidatus Aquilonibacter sp.]
MTRKSLLTASAAAGVVAAMPQALHAADLAANYPPLKAPANGQINVAFMISSQGNVIDMAGAWETFQDVMLPSGAMPFHLYTVSETTNIVEMTGGLRIEPNYSFDAGDIPDPQIVVVGAQSDGSEKVMKLLRDIQGKVDITMSVCTGAFKLAKSGILDGKSATTHHDYYDQFEKQFPKVTLVRGPRFVDNGSIVTAGGLTSGISAALHVISRYYDAQTASTTAAYMEFVPTQRPA